MWWWETLPLSQKETPQLTQKETPQLTQKEQFENLKKFVEQEYNDLFDLAKKDPVYYFTDPIKNEKGELIWHKPNSDSKRVQTYDKDGKSSWIMSNNSKNIWWLGENKSLTVKIEKDGKGWFKIVKDFGSLVGSNMEHKITTQNIAWNSIDWLNAVKDELKTMRDLYDNIISTKKVEEEQKAAEAQLNEQLAKI